MLSDGLGVENSTFPPSNEAEVEERQEEGRMDNGARSGNLRSLDDARAKDRYGHAHQEEIKENPSTHEKGARKKLAHILPWNSSEHF